MKPIIHLKTVKKMTKAKVKDFSEEIKRYEEMKNFFSIDFETGIISQIRTIINVSIPKWCD